ncbi:hypothetical protein [Bifidobacterium aesculapii]|uniref:hypothetical protein n=1 Tax=Bifidobacterium aesculapii TaxID=1329411 RepID=UPI0006E29455|nr:hypothetical protein [Bifidobacterium aesculapii]
MSKKLDLKSAQNVVFTGNIKLVADATSNGTGSDDATEVEGTPGAPGSADTQVDAEALDSSQSDGGTDAGAGNGKDTGENTGTGKSSGSGESSSGVDFSATISPQ